MEKVLEWFAKLPPPVKIAAGAIGVILQVVLYYVLSYSDDDAKLAKLHDQIRKADSTLIQKQAFAQNLNKAKREAERLEAEVEEAKANLPTSKEMAELQRRFSELADKSGVVIELFHPLSERYKNFYAEVPVELRLVGAYHEILSFFWSVSKLARIVNITDVQLSEPKLREKKVTVVANCEATTFRLTSPEERKKAEDAEAAAKKKGGAAKKGGE